MSSDNDEALNMAVSQGRYSLAKEVLGLRAELSGMQNKNRELLAQNARLKEQFEAMNRVVQNATAEPACCGAPVADDHSLGGEVCCGNPEPEWPQWYAECDTSALSETPAASLAEIELAAIEKFKNEVVESVRLPFKVHIEAVFAIVEHRIRQSAKQEGGGDDV